jgi:hypothetical protein
LAARRRGLGREQAPLDVVEAADAGVERAREGQEVGPQESEDRVGGEPRLRQRVDPLLQDPELAGHELGVLVAFDDLRGEVEVVARHRVAEGRFREVVRQVPTAGAAVETGDLVGVAPSQVLPQEVGEQPVVTEPAPVVVERKEEEVLALQALQHRLPAVVPGDRVAERAAQPVEDGGPEQEPPDIVGQRGEHLVAQIIRDEAMPAADHGPVHGLRMPAEGKRNQLQSRRPPFQSGMEGTDLLVGQSEPAQAIDKLAGFGRREGEIVAPHLHELGARPVAGQRQGRIGPPGQHQVKGGRQVVEQVSDRLMDGLLVDQVVVVEDEDRLAGRAGGEVDERREDGVAIGRRRPEEQAERALPDLRSNRLPRRQQGAEKAVRPVVLFGDREPGDGVAAVVGPLSQQRRLAVAGRRRN